MRCVVLTTTWPAEVFESYVTIIAAVRNHDAREAPWQAKGPF